MDATEQDIKFKDGDTLICIDDVGAARLTEGQEYTAVGDSHFNKYIGNAVIVSNDNGHTDTFYARRFKKKVAILDQSKNEPKFVVGEFVTCVNDGGHRELTKGKIYEVGHHSGGEFVEIPDNLGGLSMWYATRFEKTVEDAGVNPKDAIGSTKPSYEYVPIEVLYGVGNSMKDGAQKYGPFNWRQTNVQSMVYVNAARRHIDAWAGGEELASDSQCHHLDHAIAGLMILRDAQMQGCMKDTRHTPPKVGVYQL